MHFLLYLHPATLSRFKEKLVFNDWTPPNCLALLLNLCGGDDDGAELPEELHPLILRYFGQLIERSGWGNARDVNTVYEEIRSSRERRLDDVGMDSGPYLLSDMDIFARMIAQRKKEKVIPPQGTATLHVEHPVESAECSDVRNKPKLQEIKDEAVFVEDRPAEKTVEETLTMVDPEDLRSSLDEALAEMGYDIYRTAIILSEAQLPDDLVALVATKVSSTAARVRPMLVAQCPALLPPVMAIIELQRHELELQRIAREEMEKADEIEREILRVKEESRQREAVLVRVQMIGKCCMGFAWIKTEGGYRCAGGSHFVSDAAVNLV
jgi:hypothetical protein